RVGRVFEAHQSWSTTEGWCRVGRVLEAHQSPLRPSIKAGGPRRLDPPYTKLPFGNAGFRNSVSRPRHETEVRGGGFPNRSLGTRGDRFRFLLLPSALLRISQP